MYDIALSPQLRRHPRVRLVISRFLRSDLHQDSNSLLYLSFPRHPVYYHVQLPSPRHEHTWRSHVRARCTPFNVAAGGGVDGGVRERGLFVERIFNVHPLAGITVRINSQQKYARYFRRPDENSHASARRKKGKRGGCTFVRRCATRVLLSDRARQIFSAMNRRRRQRVRPLAFCLRPDTALKLIASPRSPATGR